MSVVLLEKLDNIALIKINRPDKLNALNIETLKVLLETVKAAEQDKNIRVVVLTGEGNKAFIAGADISELNKLNPTEAKEFSLLGNSIIYKLENMGKITIACINGYALGGGSEIALGCTFRFLSEDAVLGQPEVKLGIMPGFGGSQRLTRFLGKAKALEICLLGNNINAEEALKLGIANRIFKKEELLDKTIEFAKKAGRSAPIAVKYIIESINKGSHTSLEESIDYEAHLFALCFATEDMKEGTSAFLSKRAPDFKGR